MSDPVDHSPPPVGEEIHLPGPTVIPFVNALGLTFIVISTTLGTLFLIAGAILFGWSTIKWIVDTKRDVEALPEDHGHGH
jgi:hypothetical protein